MTTYTVTVTRNLTQTYTNTIEASSPNEASEIAIEQAAQGNFEDVYDDTTTSVEQLQSQYNSIASLNQPQSTPEYTPVRSVQG